MAFLKSLLFNIFFYTSLPIICLLIIFLYPFISSINLSKVGSSWIKIVLYFLKIVCGLKWSVIGEHNIPKTPVIVVSNHQGQWESLFLQTLVHPISSIIKKELLLIPFFGWALAFMNPIPINRKNKIQSLKKVLKHASARLKNNYSVLIFPEGTRVSPELGISSFGNSCGLLSVNNNIPILPICHNSGKYWQNKKFIKKAGVIKVSIGPLFKGDDPKELTREVQLWMQNEYKKMF
jgi:1-acyl-sn-glycerol-3-phosphate acyltransferase